MEKFDSHSANRARIDFKLSIAMKIPSPWSVRTKAFSINHRRLVLFILVVECLINTLPYALASEKENSHINNHYFEAPLLLQPLSLIASLHPN